MPINIFLILILICAGCANAPKEEKKISDSPDNPIKLYKDNWDTLVYSKVMIPDTNNCSFFKNGRRLIAVLENKKCVIETTGVDLYLKNEKNKLWVCNLPKELKNIGDTIIVSAHVYNIFGDERTWGSPTILHKIYSKN